MFERFTDNARQVIVHAQDESRGLRHRHIGTEHLLLGLLHDDETALILDPLGVSLGAARDLIGQTQGLGPTTPHGHLPFTAPVKQVLEQSLRHAQRLHNTHIAPPHLLLALLDNSDDVAVKTLLALDADLDVLVSHAEQQASAGDRGSRPGRSSAVPTTFSAPWPRWRSDRPALVPRPGPGEDLTVVAGEVAHRDALAQALRRYGRHDPDCDPAQQCTCGLEQVLNRLDRPDDHATT